VSVTRGPIGISLRSWRIGSIFSVIGPLVAIALWAAFSPDSAIAKPDNSICLSKVVRVVPERYCTNTQTVVTGQNAIRSCDSNNICHTTYLDLRSRICTGWATRQVERQMCVWGCKPGFSAVPGLGPNDGCYAGEQLARRIQKAARTGASSPAFRGVQNLLQRCDLGQGSSCRELGVKYGEGAAGLDRDDVEAARMFDRACDNDDMLGCSLLGAFLATGSQGLQVDEAKAVAPLRKGCEGLEASACSMLGVMYAVGHGGLPRDRKEALRIFAQAAALDPSDEVAGDWIKRLKTAP
jgi:hypothetical protein